MASFHSYVKLPAGNSCNMSFHGRILVHVQSTVCVASARWKIPAVITYHGPTMIMLSV